MGAFEYAALDAQGKEKKGVLEGDSVRQVRSLLREQNLIPLKVDEVQQKETRRGQGISLRRSISATDLALITRQLATLSRSGLPLDEATATVARQSEKTRLQKLMLGVRSRVVEGHSLADGLATYPHVFPELYRATVAAGEQSGHLDAVLERLADYTENRQQLQQRIQLALFYPIILTVLAIVVVSALLAYVVPEVVKVFENTGQELPGLTQALIASSDFLRSYGVLVVIVLAAAFAGFLALLKQAHFKEQWHRFLLRLPVAGKLIRGTQTARFSRTLSILAASGVSLLDALRIAAQVMGNLPMRHAVEATIERVREGAGLARSLEQTGYFPPMFVNLVASGESSGDLEEMLERAATNQERELETTIAMLMGLMEPVLILTMGAVVLLIVLAILLPIFDLNQLVR
ncbi:MAG: type II secretion system inner membrane protein GspF [Thioalkalispiraceae bacterium]|jgi:general secretion pathway protein F